MHPSGQLPAYEWALGDVNPPVHAWAVWRVYKIERGTRQGRPALPRARFHKLLLNFTWWVNRKDTSGNNVFEGGFLGLDNIGVFDRSKPLPTGGILEQSDGTSWMAMYSINLLAIALELARVNPAYEDVASKFWEHFLYIANAMSKDGGRGIDLWDEQDGFFYDVLHLPDDSRVPLRVRSMVGLIPLFAVETLEPKLLTRIAGLLAAARLVHRQPAGSGRACRVDVGPRPWRAPAAVGGRPGSAPPDSRGDARPERVPLAAWHPGAVAPPHGRAVPLAVDGIEYTVGVRAGRVANPACSEGIPTGAGRCGFR